MKALAQVLPHPVLSVSLLMIWLTLNASVQPSHILLGAVLGIALPLLSRAYWPERPPFHRLPLLWRLFFQVNWDIVAACVKVARLTFMRRSVTLQPKFATIALECRNEYARVLLINILGLTPGTLVVDLDHEEGLMLVHWLHEPHLDEAIAHIKTRYETPLREILG